MEREAAGSGEVLDFSADLNPLGPPPGLEEVLLEGAREIRLYPEPSYQNLREALAEFEGTRPERLLVGNGTADLIHLITRWAQPKRVAVVAPTFTEYERAAAADRAQVLPWLLREERGFSSEALEGPERLREAQVLFLCNPNNPTGGLWPQSQLRRWLERAHRAGCLTVVDEAYMDFVGKGRRYSAAAWIEEFPQLVVLRSLTKIFSVPGLRIGYLVSSPERVSALSQVQPPWPVNGLAVRAGAWLVRQEEYLEESRREMERFKRVFETALQGLSGLRPFPSEANFFLCRLTGPGASAERLGGELSARGILVRLCDDFRGLEPDRFFRTAVRTPEENSRLLEALREILRAG